MEAVGVLPCKREVPDRLAKPAFHRGEVARLVAGVAPQRVWLGGPVRPRKELTIEEWHGGSRRTGENIVVSSKKARSVWVDAREKATALTEAVVDDDGRHRIRTRRRGLRRERHLHVRQQRIGRVSGSVPAEYGKRMIRPELEHRFRIVAILQASDGGTGLTRDSQVRVESHAGANHGCRNREDDRIVR